MEKSLIEQFEERNLLVSTDNWFYAPDGQMYRSAWGKVKVYDKQQTLGIKPDAKSTSWYATVGEGDGAIVIAGCQIHYAIVCDNRPKSEEVEEERWVDSKGEAAIWKRKPQIYFAQ